MIRIAPLLSLLLAGCTAPRPSTGPAPDPETAEVVAVANRLFAAMEARDTTELRRMFLPQARLVSIGSRDGAPVVRERSLDDFIPGIATAPQPLRERMWSPEVRVDGDLATLWAPYDFHLGAQWSHCGTDAFHLVRLGGAWRRRPQLHGADGRLPARAADVRRGHPPDGPAAGDRGSGGVRGALAKGG